MKFYFINQSEFELKAINIYSLSFRVDQEFFHELIFFEALENMFIA